MWELSILNKYLYNIMKSYGKEQYFLCSSKFVYARKGSINLNSAMEEKVSLKLYAQATLRKSSNIKTFDVTVDETEGRYTDMTQNYIYSEDDEDYLIDLYKQEYVKINKLDHYMSNKRVSLDVNGESDE